MDWAKLPFRINSLSSAEDEFTIVKVMNIYDQFVCCLPESIFFFFNLCFNTLIIKCGYKEEQ